MKKINKQDGQIIAWKKNKFRAVNSVCIFPETQVPHFLKSKDYEKGMGGLFQELEFIENEYIKEKILIINIHLFW